MKIKNILITIALSLVAIIGLGLAYLHSGYFHLFDNCDEKTFFTDGSVKGIVVNCGATSNYVTQVLISDNPVLVLEDDYSNKCKINLSDSQTLNISCSSVKNEDIFLNKSSEGDVKINFINQ